MFDQRRTTWRQNLRLFLAWAIAVNASGQSTAPPKTYARSPITYGDAPSDPGPLASDLSSDIRPEAIQRAMKKVADWQIAKVKDSPSQDWTFAPLYLGLLSASQTVKNPEYASFVQDVGQHFNWTLGPRKTHADDQAIGQSYLWLYAKDSRPQQIAPLRTQFDEVMQKPDDPDDPVWWWCDALFMAPPVWSGLAQATHDPRYLDYMDREWHITSSLLWDPEEHLFSRDKTFLDKHESNGRKIFWTRGNGWVMGGLVGVLEMLPPNDPRRPFYISKFKDMADAVARVQQTDGLWRPGLLDAKAYPAGEVSGSAFFLYAMAWGMNHHLLDEKKFGPIVTRGWAGLIGHIYADGRLGSIQPVGAAPGAYTASASYVYGVGAFLLAGSEVDKWAMKTHPMRPKT